MYLVASNIMLVPGVKDVPKKFVLDAHLAVRKVAITKSKPVAQASKVTTKPPPTPKSGDQEKAKVTPFLPE